MRDIIKGQEAIEFILITILIFFGTLFVMLAFGDRIASFFKSESSVAKTALTTPNVLKADKGSKFQPDYQVVEDINSNKELYETLNAQTENTLSDVIISEPSKGTVTLTIGEITVKNIPEDLPGMIKTSGASGASKEIAKAMDFLMADLNEVMHSDPDNEELKSIVKMAQKVAESGYLLSDAEEWVETAAKRLESNTSIQLPENNMLCQDGKLKSKTRQCDSVVGIQNFLYSRSNDLATLLDDQLTELNYFNKKLKELSDAQDNQKVKEATAIINTLTDEMNDVADNVRETAIDNKDKIKNFDDLKAGVASKTTNLKSKLIEHYRKKMAGQKENDHSKAKSSEQTQ